MSPEIVPVLTPPTAVSSPSPVTWHVLIWTLLSLAISTMAQPPTRIIGIPSRYRIYLASSPILCITDAFSTIIKLITTSIFLPISFQQSLNLVLHARSDSEKKEGEPEPQPWPRWLFFIIGTLPAAIKLSSFSGVPWSKTWGLMFGISFVITEIFATFSRSENSSVESSLGFTTPEWKDPTNAYLRKKVMSLQKKLKIFETLLFRTAILAHLALLFWTIKTLWLPTSKLIDTSPTANYILLYGKLFISGMYLLLGPVYSIGYCCRVKLSPLLTRWFWNLLYFEFGSMLLPSCKLLFLTAKSDKPLGWSYRVNEAVAVYIYAYVYLCGTGWGGYWCVSKFSKRWPGLGRVLLLDVRGERMEGKIDVFAWLAFCFFLFNLASCILWYAFIYEQEGTVQPAWTDIFG